MAGAAVGANNLLAALLALEWLQDRATREDIERWLRDKGAAKALVEALWPILLELWRQGYEIGEEAARHASGYKGAVRGVQALIDSQGATWLNQIINTLLDRLADILAEHADDDISVNDLAAELSERMGDRSAAEMIAQTEITRAASAAAVDVYQAAGIYEVQWVVEDQNACPECLANAASGPHVYGNPFPSGDISPPAHPHCRCALLPYRR